MSIEIDFYTDWIEMAKKHLNLLGVTLQTSVDKDSIPFIYFNCKKRIIPKFRRRILKSDVFRCPPELSDGLTYLENKIVNGEDLTPHLSKLVLKKYDSRDYMLNDWGIYHLHLGKTIEADGFVTRTGPVLYCRVDQSCVYFIHIKDHGNWSEQELLRIVYRNWKDTLEPHIVKGALGTENHPTNDEIKALRKANVNTLLEIDNGVVLAPPGGGYATDGTSMEVVLSRDNLIKYLEDFESQIKKNEDEIRKQIQTKTIPASQLQFKLEYRSNRFVAYEVYSKMFFA